MDCKIIRYISLPLGLEVGLGVQGMKFQIVSIVPPASQ